MLCLLWALTLLGLLSSTQGFAAPSTTSTTSLSSTPTPSSSSGSSASATKTASPTLSGTRTPSPSCTSTTSTLYPGQTVSLVDTRSDTGGSTLGGTLVTLWNGGSNQPFSLAAVVLPHASRAFLLTNVSTLAWLANGQTPGAGTSLSVELWAASNATLLPTALLSAAPALASSAALAANPGNGASYAGRYTFINVTDAGYVLKAASDPTAPTAYAIVLSPRSATANSNPAMRSTNPVPGANRGQLVYSAVATNSGGSWSSGGGGAGGAVPGSAFGVPIVLAGVLLPPASASPSSARTPSPSPTPTRSPTTTKSAPITPTATPSAGASPSRTPTPSVTGSRSATPSATPSVTPTACSTASGTASPTRTATASRSPTATSGVLEGALLRAVDTTGAPAGTAIGASFVGSDLSPSAAGAALTVGTSGSVVGLYLTPDPVVDLVLDNVTFGLAYACSSGSGRCNGVTTTVSLVADFYLVSPSGSLLQITTGTAAKATAATLSGTSTPPYMRYVTLPLPKAQAADFCVYSQGRTAGYAAGTYYILVLRATSVGSTCGFGCNFGNPYLPTLAAPPNSNFGILPFPRVGAGGSTPNNWIANANVYTQGAFHITAVVQPLPSPSPTSISSASPSNSATPTGSALSTQASSPSPTPASASSTAAAAPPASASAASTGSATAASTGSGTASPTPTASATQSSSAGGGLGAEGGGSTAAAAAAAAAPSGALTPGQGAGLGIGLVILALTVGLLCWRHFVGGRARLRKKSPLGASSLTSGPAGALAARGPVRGGSTGCLGCLGCLGVGGKGSSSASSAGRGGKQLRGSAFGPANPSPFAAAAGGAMQSPLYNRPPLQQQHQQHSQPQHQHLPGGLDLEGGVGNPLMPSAPPLSLSSAQSERLAELKEEMAELKAAAAHQATFETASKVVAMLGGGGGSSSASSSASAAAAALAAHAFQEQSGRGDPLCSWAVAMFDYAPMQGDELALLPEDRVWVLVQGVDGNEAWHRGVLCDGGSARAKGKEGVFPAAYVRMLKESEALAQGLPLTGPAKGSAAAASGRGKLQRLVKKFVEVEEEVVEEEEEEEEEAEEEVLDEEPLPEGWVVKGLKKGTKNRQGRGKIFWYENVVTGKVTMKRPRK